MTASLQLREGHRIVRAPAHHEREGFVSDQRSSPDHGDQEIPLGQRLYDNWFLLLIAGIVVMVVFYTGWGLWEVARVPPATLP